MIFVNRLLVPLAVLVGAVYSIQSAWLGYSLLRPIQFWDQLASVEEYLIYLDGQFGIRALLRFHNEHRIATSRIAYLIDAIYFDFSNRFLISCIYVSLLALCSAIAVLALRSRNAASLAAATVIALGIGWSVSQHENLSWGFQTQFPFVHLFAMASFVCFGRMLTTDRSSQRVVWFVLAFLMNVLGALTSAGGLLIGIAALSLCVWLRSWNRWVIVFAAAHLVLMGVYLVGVPPHPETHPVSLVDIARFFFRCVGSIARSQPRAPAILGVIIIFLSSAFMIRRAWDSMVVGRTTQRADYLLLTLILFVILETVATTIGRAGMGVDQALVPRYATQSAILVLAVLALCWRTACQYSIARAATLIGTIALAVLANNPDNITEWKDEIARRDTAMFSFINGVYPPSQLRGIFGVNTELVEQNYKRLAQLRKGPFALSATVYRPPLNSLSGVALSDLPSCRGNIEGTESTEEWLELRGWIAAHTGPHAPAWLIASSGDGRILGFTTPYLRRPDVSAALGLSKNDRTGFDLFLRKQGSEPDRTPQISLVAVFSRAPFACVFAISNK